RRALDLGSNATPLGGGSTSLTMKLTESLTDVNGFAFIINFDPSQLTPDMTAGDNGVQLSPGLSRASLITHLEPGRLSVGITLKGDVIHGIANLCTISFIPSDELQNGFLSDVLIDDTRGARICRKPGGSPVFESVESNGGTVVIRK
ncbi:MAG: hypothetical protein J7M18_00955, partial [Candidatus Eremiobacteraeota bacterium]|nr:hypothetical protein [Candidatus Eremiobacteraeota bacterium]